MNLRTREVTRDGRKIELQAKEFSPFGIPDAVGRSTRF